MRTTRIVSFLLAVIFSLVTMTEAQARSKMIPRRLAYHQIIQDQTFESCLMDNLIHETRGVRRRDADAARVEITRVLISRTHDKRFPKSVCKALNQKHYVKTAHRVVCQFSWKCTRAKVEKLDVALVMRLKAAVHKAISLQRRYGDLDALFYTSNGTCPVPFSRRYSKGGFTFCVEHA